MKAPIGAGWRYPVPPCQTTQHWIAASRKHELTSAMQTFTARATTLELWL